MQKKEKEKKGAYGTPDSHVVPHRSTDEACSGLTAQFGRDTVRFTEYGRRRQPCVSWVYIYDTVLYATVRYAACAAGVRRLALRGVSSLRKASRKLQTWRELGCACCCCCSALLSCRSCANVSRAAMMTQCHSRLKHVQSRSLPRAILWIVRSETRHCHWVHGWTR